MLRLADQLCSSNAVQSLASGIHPAQRLAGLGNDMESDRILISSAVNARWFGKELAAASDFAVSDDCGSVSLGAAGGRSWTVYNGSAPYGCKV